VAAHAAIATVEARALQDMQLMPGVLELSAFLDQLGVPRALVTRNVNCECRRAGPAGHAGHAGRVGCAGHTMQAGTLKRDFPPFSLIPLYHALPSPLPCPAASIEFFHRHHFTLPPFAPALSREFAPYKPDPASLLHIAERWGMAPGEMVMIGDSAKDDVSCCACWA
jgi:beta-phosphoglucomutase-like phosphatase (HAD superfamily)